MTLVDDRTKRVIMVPYSLEITQKTENLEIRSLTTLLYNPNESPETFGKKSLSIETKNESKLEFQCRCYHAQAR